MKKGKQSYYFCRLKSSIHWNFAEYRYKISTFVDPIAPQLTADRPNTDIRFLLFNKLRTNKINKKLT